MPRKAQLSRAPESRAEAGLGASLWASGSQVCMGASPILVPKPMSTKRKPVFSQSGSSRSATLFSEVKVRGISRPARSSERVMKKKPSRARAMPTEQMSTYFQVASRAFFERLMKISGALARVVASMAIHRTMGWSASAAMLIVPRKRSMQPR